MRLFVCCYRVERDVVVPAPVRRYASPDSDPPYFRDVYDQRNHYYISRATAWAINSEQLAPQLFERLRLLHRNTHQGRVFRSVICMVPVQALG